MQTDFLTSKDTKATDSTDVIRTKRLKKPKQINDLGFEEKTHRKQKINKLQKDITIKIKKKLTNCQIIFEKFKESNLYPKFTFFHRIEKSLRANNYNTHQELASEIRGIFNNYFTAAVNDPQAYNDTWKFSTYFEDIYKEYENKIFTKESKNILELKKKMNRLRREIRERNSTGSNAPLKNTKLRIDVNEFNIASEKEKKISKKYKMSLVNNIRSLNSEQIKGVINIIHDNLSVEEKTLEFDINNLSLDKLKELDKYVRKCLKIKKKEVVDNIHSNNINKTFINRGLTSSQELNRINVNININNNFVVGEFKTENNIYPEENQILKKRQSILSQSDSLSSDEESGKMILI